MNQLKIVKICLTLSFLMLSIYSQANFTQLESFGDNPGNLSASYLLPQTRHEPLVIFLHGCQQNAKQTAITSGLLALAELNNFALLLPQQNKANNVQQCFNWFSSQDINKEQGENLSLKNMILTMQELTQSNEVYIMGVSAGGAMVSNLVINYPNLFTGAAIIAGLPYPCANSLIKAISCMRNGPNKSVADLIDFVKQQNQQQSYWPKLSIWSSEKDQTVNPKNSEKMTQQWLGLMELSPQSRVQRHNGYQVTQWYNAAGNSQLQWVQLDELTHGLPVNPTIKNGGSEGDYLLKAPVSAVMNIIHFWLPETQKT